MDVFEYLEKETRGKFDEDGEQVKLTEEQIERNTEGNKSTVYANLRRIKEREGVKHEVYQVRRHKEGRKIVFEQSFWWIK